MAITIKKSPSLAVLQMASFSGSDAIYTVDRANRTCTCPAFITDGYCKHLENVGVYRAKNWKQSSYPTFSQALSALVKSLRLRRVEDAVYWLYYLHNFKEDGKGYRFRLARRLLIGSAEDGHSIAVMEVLSRNFPTLCRQDTPLYRMVAEVLRICGVPNWWSPESNGPDYIHKGMVANRRAGLYKDGGVTTEEQLQQLRVGILDKDALTALTNFERLLDNKEMKRDVLAKYLFDMSNELGVPEARRLTLIHLNHKAALSNDANFLCQAVWYMLGGNSPLSDEIHIVKTGDVMPLIESAKKRWMNPLLIPGWCCDGIHCSGTDRRFAGIWHDMDAVCTAYAHHGSLDPSLKWLPRFYSLDGLTIVS